MEGASMFEGVHHVAVIASDYERSKDFYTRILGLPVIREVWREARGSWKCDLAVGATQIELFSFPAPPPRPSRPEACGLRHLAFTVDRLEPVIERLRAAGVEVEPVRVDEHTGQRFTFFADPDGLPLELYETHADASSGVSRRRGA
jgi:glyoxylase I family protein